MSSLGSLVGLLAFLDPVAALCVIGAVTLALGIWAIMHRWNRRDRHVRGHAAAEPDLVRETLSRLAQERAVRDAIARIVARGGDLAGTAEETLDVMRRAARMDIGVVYRLDGASGSLVLLTHRGLDAELAAVARARPLAGGPASWGRTQVIRFDTAGRVKAPLGDMAERRGYRTQLALAIPAGDRTWGALVLISHEARDFSAEEILALEAAAHQVGFAVERAELQETASARLKRLEAQREIERHISEQLDLEELLVIVAGSARRLIGGAFSIVYLREGDVLCARAWTELADWIRDVRIPVGVGVTGTAVATGQGLIVNDYPSSPLAMPPFHNVTLRLLAQPLMAGGRALGVMVISREDTGAPFTPDDLSTLADFATQAAVAIENARLFAEAKQSATQYQALFEVAGLVGSTLDTERLLDVIVDRCRVLMGVASAGITRLDADTGMLVYERGVGLSPEFVSALRLRPGEGTTGRALRDGVPVWTADILEDPAISLAPETRDLVVREGYRAVLSVPILIKGQPHGVLVAYWWEPHTPLGSEIALMSALAGQAAMALDNARLYGAATARGKRLVTLARLTETLTATLAPEDVLHRVVHSAVGLFGSSVSGLWLMSEDGRSLVLRAHAGTRTPLVGARRLDLGEGLMGRIVAGREPLVVPDLSRDPRVKNVEDVEVEGVVSFAGVPLILGDRVLGALSVALRETRRFSEEDLSLLHSLGNHAAIAIENARVFAEERRREAYLSALLDVNKKIGALAPAEPLLQSIAEEAARLLDVDNAGFRLLEGDELVVAGLAGTARETMLRPRIKAWESMSGRVASEGRALICEIDTMPAAIPEHRAAGQRLGYTTYMGVPLRVGARTIGVLSFRARRPLGAGDQEVAEAFAGQAAIVIENARLYDEAARHAAALDVRADRLRTLARLTNTVSSSLDAGAVLQAIATAAAEIMQAPFVTVYVAHEGVRTLELRAASDARMGAALPAKRPAFGEGLAGWVAEHRRPLAVADVATDARAVAAEWARTCGLRSFLGVPIIFQDSLLGVLTLNGTVPFELGADDESLLDSFVSQAAVAIRNTRLHAETARRLEETRAMLEVTAILNSQPGPPAEVMRRTARAVAHNFGADMVGIYILDGRKEALVPLAGYHVPRHLLPVFSTRPFVLARFPILRAAWRGGQPFWSADVKNDPRIDRATFEGVDPHSVLLAPTMVRGEAVGALFLVWWGTGREFQPAEIRLMEGVASQVGLAMENAELARQTQQKLDETEHLLSVSRTLASTLDIETLPRQFLRHVVGALAADTAGMWLLDEGGEWMEPLAGYHVPPHRLAALRKLRLSIVQHPLYAEAARTRRPVVAADVMHDARIPQELRDAFPHRTQIFVPIIAKDRVLGGFGVTWGETHRELSEGELRLIEAIASQAGVALENARLFRDNERRVQELSVLNELARAVTGQLDQAELLDTIEQQVARLLDVRHMMILLHDESRASLEVVLRVKDGVRENGGRRDYPRRAAGLSGIVLDSGRPIRTADYIGECARRDVEPVPESLDLPHWLGVPMAADNRPLGVLALRSRDRAFTDGDQRLLASVADLAALALRSARLYEERARAHGELAAAQDQLVRTEKLRAMGEMASGVAHDFNNVLASIVGRAQLLLGQVQDPKLRQWVEVIERSALDGARTVRRLQDFTRIRRDHPVVPVDLNQVVQQTLEATESSWRHEPQRRGIRVEVATSLAVPLPEVPGDPAELREALTNLILNALDAMPAGGKLALATTVRGADVEVAVADTGVGIPAAIRHKIFDPFFTTKGPKGTGLGLSMTYGILARHGARITVEGEEGRGTTFRLIFPAATAASEPTGPAEAPPTAVASLRCLVVDDEEAVAAVLGDMLASEGHRVEVVDSGDAAIARFSTEAFDLVLTDLAMPGMTGWEVARAIKDMAPSAPVVLVSGFGVEVAPEDLRAHGVDLVLAKPLKLQDIGSAVALIRAAS